MQATTTSRNAWKATLLLSAWAIICVGPAVRPCQGQLVSDLPENMQQVGVDQKLGDRLPLDAEFTNELGEKVTLGDYFDSQKPVLLTLNYSDCPMLCSMQLNQLVKSLQELELEIGKDYQVVTVSIDPKETPTKARETKAKYVGALRRDGAQQGWHFLVGKQLSITQLAHAVGFRYKFIPETGDYSHAAMLAFCTPEGKISSYLLLIDYEPNQLNLGLVDAGGGNVGSLVDNFLLYCSVYDPKAGSYTASAYKIMRLAGIATVVALLVLLTPYWFGRRRAADPSQTQRFPNPRHARTPQTATPNSTLDV